MIPKRLQPYAAQVRGKRIAVTGSTGGLGRELCRYLGMLGASLWLLDRNADRSEAHKRELERDFGIDVTCVPLDLAELGSVEAATARLLREGIDVFIHNAGAYSIPRTTCDSGYDNVFQINFASPYYMLRRLMPMLRARGGRAVAVGSIAHTYSVIDPADIDFASRKAASKVYGNAKRFLMFSLYALFREERTAHLAVVHPGITLTNITAHYPKPIFALIKYPMKVLFMSPKKAALSILQGVWEDTAPREWIGPRWFGIWGQPKKTILNTCSDEEAQAIAALAEEVYAQCERTVRKKETAPVV